VSMHDRNAGAGVTKDSYKKNPEVGLLQSHLSLRTRQLTAGTRCERSEYRVSRLLQAQNSSKRKGRRPKKSKRTISGRKRGGMEFSMYDE